MSSGFSTVQRPFWHVYLDHILQHNVVFATAENTIAADLVGITRPELKSLTDVDFHTERQRSNAIIKKALFATLALAVLSSAASAAEYYVVQERDTKKCKVVETRPTETTWVQVGPLAFKTQEEADRQLKVICKETR